MRKFIYYICLILFIFVVPHEIGTTNLLPLKTILFILFFVGPVLKITNVVGKPVDETVKKFKKFDEELKRKRF